MALFRLKYFLMIALLMACFFACKEPSVKKEKLNKKAITESFIKANKELLESENEDIEDFLKRYPWNMTRTGSGLRYMINDPGTGRQVKWHDIVRINYRVAFLTGDVVESTEKTGPMEFRVGQGDVVAGMHEGVLFMHEGGKARFIFPSHLAYGFTGKPGKIPPKTTLIYDVEIIEIK